MNHGQNTHRPFPPPPKPSSNPNRPTNHPAHLDLPHVVLPVARRHQARVVRDGRERRRVLRAVMPLLPPTARAEGGKGPPQVAVEVLDELVLGAVRGGGSCVSVGFRVGWVCFLGGEGKKGGRRVCVWIRWWRRWVDWLI
jgi:hypothetical protein